MVSPIHDADSRQPLAVGPFGEAFPKLQITDTPPMRCLTCRLLHAERRHEADPRDERHAARVDEIMQHINGYEGWDVLVQTIADCEFILQRAFHPLPEWVLEGDASRP